MADEKKRVTFCVHPKHINAVKSSLKYHGCTWETRPVAHYFKMIYEVTAIGHPANVDDVVTRLIRNRKVY